MPPLRFKIDVPGRIIPGKIFLGFETIVRRGIHHITYPKTILVRSMRSHLAG